MNFCVETRREYFDWAEPIPGPTIDRMRDVARETGTVLLARIFERAPDGRFFNSATVIGPDGQLIGEYRKSSIPLMDTAQRADRRRAVGDVVHRVGALDAAHDRDGLLEDVGRILARTVHGERLVEVDVWRDEGRRREAAGRRRSRAWRAR